MYDQIVNDLISFSIQNETEFKHYGKGHLDGGHSGRYPYGSGGRPYQHDKRARAQYLKNKKVSSGSSKPVEEKKFANEAIRQAYYINKGVNIHDYGKEPKLKARYNKLDKISRMLGVFDGDIFHDKSSKRLKEDNERREKLIKDEKSGFYLKDSKESNLLKEEQMKLDAERSNPLYSEFRHGYTHNCALCAMTYDMRRRGYDVRAREFHGGFDVGGTGKAFYDKDLPCTFVMYQSNLIPTPTKSQIDAAMKNINRLPKNSYGLVDIGYSKALSGGGHAMAFDRINGETIITCPQTNTRWNLSNEKERNNCFSCIHSMHFYRTDNRTPNLKRMHEVCE